MVKVKKKTLGTFINFRNRTNYEPAFRILHVFLQLS